MQTENPDKQHYRFATTLYTFEQLSRETGYYNAVANRSGDEADIKHYETLRTKQLKMYAELLKMFPKQQK